MTSVDMVVIRLHNALWQWSGKLESHGKSLDIWHNQREVFYISSYIMNLKSGPDKSQYLCCHTWLNRFESFFELMPYFEVSGLCSSAQFPCVVYFTTIEYSQLRFRNWKKNEYWWGEEFVMPDASKLYCASWWVPCQFQSTCLISKFVKVLYTLLLEMVVKELLYPNINSDQFYNHHLEIIVLCYFEFLFLLI